MNYFEGIKTIEELKIAYKRLAKKYHPDVNQGIDTTAIMQEVNKQFEALFDVLKFATTGTAEEQRKRQATAGTASQFMDIISKVAHLNINIEIIGSWVWLSGETKAVKDVISKAGFTYAPKKKMWYWYEEGSYIRTATKRYTIEEIRNYYGTQSVRSREEMESIG